MPISPEVTTVLLVEDEPLIRMHGMDILEDAGFRVLEAADADEAIAILEGDEAIHLLFSDVDMPGTMDGLQLVQLVHERWPDIGLLVTSGNHRLLDSDVPGSGRFFRKPWTINALTECICLMTSK
jgi:CheY-like chemotaxis protein